jgi:ABC-type polysaccharide/polyol phosphate transport system ATPase subunit
MSASTTNRIVFEKVSKAFSLGGGRKLLRGHLRDWLKPRQSFFALRDVSLQVRDGESVALIGPNGAGKSTLLNLTTGLCYPDQGSVTVNGRVSAVLELGGGFHHDLTGEENLRLAASLQGLTRKRAEELRDVIVEFSGIGDFIREPIRTYSSGMVLRLAFSVAVHADPEILLIDEVIAVGDQAFQTRCFERMQELRRSGKTMLCVSHSPELLAKMCDRAVWLDHGQVIADGKIGEVVDAYQGKTITRS